MAFRREGASILVIGPAGFLGFLLWDLLNIIVINLGLSGNNAILIAMGSGLCFPAPGKKGFYLGAGAAVALRIVLTFIIWKVLGIPFVKLAADAPALDRGQTLRPGVSGREKKRSATLLQAVWIMLVADLTMSLDNVIAIAGASHGNFLLLVLGPWVLPFLSLSLPAACSQCSWTAIRS